jgi:mannosyltransferase PIG-V
VLAREQFGWADVASSLSVRAVLGSRLIVWAAGLIAVAIFGRNLNTMLSLDPNGASAPFHSAAANFLLAPVARWDSIWYLQIAHNGYFSQQSSAMFPLYPLLIHIGTLVFRSELLVALAISLVSVTVGLSLLERLLRLDFDERTARTTVLLIAFFPVSLFFSAAYTESLYLLLSVGALYAARRDRWAWAGALGGLAAASRSPGILTAAPLAIIYLYGPRPGARLGGPGAWWRPRHRVSASAAWLGLVPAGLFAYIAYLGVAHGQPLATFHAEQLYWRHELVGPLGGIAQAIARVPRDVSHVLAGTGPLVWIGDPISWSGHNLIDLGFLAFALVGLIGAWRRVPFAYFVYAVLLLVMATSSPVPHEPLPSISRYILVIFPVFLGWALLLGRRPRLTRFVLPACAILLAVFSGLWATWAWVA